MHNHRIQVTDVIDSAIDEVIDGGLNAFNDEVMGFSDRHPLAVIIRDLETDKVLGGITGRTSLGLLFVDVFYLPKNLRNSGLGTKILALFENEGRLRGCVSAVLYTISF